MSTADQTDRDNRASPAYFEVAKHAAARGEPHRMLEALALSGFLDGLVRSLNAKWARMPEDEIKDCIGLAVDSAYLAISQGRRVRDLGAWLWKVADNNVNDRWNDCYQARALIEAADSIAAVDQGPHDESDERRAEHRRAEAIRLARQLIPRIGQGQVATVMGVVIDAVEGASPTCPPRQSPTRSASPNPPSGHFSRAGSTDSPARRAAKGSSCQMTSGSSRQPTREEATDAPSQQSWRTDQHGD